VIIREHLVGGLNYHKLGGLDLAHESWRGPKSIPLRNKRFR
jgi:hypothetical protein